MTAPLRIALSAVCLLLAACATPRQQCENDATAPYRAALAEQARNADDLARGYTYETNYEHVTRFVTCRSRDGTFYPCWTSGTIPVTRKVPIDRAALEARQAEVARRLPKLRLTAQLERAQCRALFPDDPEEAG
ncbi:excinuclease ABC subunit B [Aestuariicoccus sp. MJ-SS9]|uniref:excinuclease ABC subunit B n=1 Tax=Aestuariicoccus sp. MJ-SS9 TaxID=3079855 RepID=UPI002911C9DC|nr:excinuclease ABC subunit B [Aestuariicoccus sp. MJ-SS9]MDU8911795.1 excinuclease ABC subunit B [Aestuariicoccus sp. MJ-SS9]